jgi:PTH1 family peptidyl-tRNA hydrolase
VATLSSFFGFFCRKKPLVKADYLVFGVGNPGDRYKNTRHNAGFMVVDCLGGSLTDARTRREPSFEAIRGTLSGRTVALVKPTTFVNRCGAAFAASDSLFCVPLESCLVVVDDYHLPLGALRLRRGGSDGGHNGLASIIESCGENVARLRLGIGPLPPGSKSVDFVLGKFDEQELPAVDAAVLLAASAAAAFCSQGIERAMNLFNRG